MGYTSQILSEFNDGKDDFTVTFSKNATKKKKKQKAKNGGGDEEQADDVTKEPLKDVDVTFSPGNLGIIADWTTGGVDSVTPHAQADSAGVKSGWKMDKVEGNAYTEGMLSAFNAGSDDFTVTFKAPMDRQ